MSRPTTTQALIPSILDRLIDRDPEQKNEIQSTRNQVIDELRESVRRDLEILLNTRVPHLPKKSLLTSNQWQADEMSVMNYGIPDYSGVNLSSDDERSEFAKLIEKIIIHFETRFKVVDVKVINSENDIDRTFRFRIDALLKVEPAVKAIVFDSSFESVTHKFQVKDVDRG